MSALLLACGTHWLTGLAFASPALILPLGLVTLAKVDRRRERNDLH